MNYEKKLNYAVKLSQSYILLLLKEYLSAEQLNKIKNLFDNSSVALQELKSEINEFNKGLLVDTANYQDNKITISADKFRDGINTEADLNQLLATIIHEYAHKIRKNNNESGGMFEESFASIFAELCINNARLKRDEKSQANKQKLFNMLNSEHNQKYDSQVSALLYVLKQKNMDKRMIVEYIAGNQDYFKYICNRLLGNEFEIYFKTVIKKENDNSEQMIVDILTKYIKTNGLSIRNYWQKNSHLLSENNLYFQGSTTLSKAVVQAGKKYLKTDEKSLYKYAENSVQMDSDNEYLIQQEKIYKIRKDVITMFSLHNKTLEEIDATIIDLCFSYIQHKNRGDEESQIFIGEIIKAIPDIENFKSKFVQLKRLGQDKKIFDHLDIINLSYEDIHTSMDLLLKEHTNGFSRSLKQ